MRHFSRATLAVALFSSMACYHAIVLTGRAESSTVYEKPWASSFIFGLVPPDPIDVSSQCKSGVAKVETMHSFLNALVAFLTLQIYTPMDIRVTCAGSGAAPRSSMLTPSADTPAARRDAMAAAVDLARRSGQPVFVQF
jgi:Bor protein